MEQQAQQDQTRLAAALQRGPWLTSWSSCTAVPSILNCGASLQCLLHCQPGSVQWKQEIVPWPSLQALSKASQRLGKLLSLLLKGQLRLCQPLYRVC